MPNWFLFDSAVFGTPASGLGQTTGEEKRKALGDVGASQFVEHNPTAPMEINPVYTWSGAQFNQFRLDWRDLTKWGHGSQWVRADLPLMMMENRAADKTLYPYRQKTQHFFSVTIGDNSPRFGWQMYGGGNVVGGFSGGLIQGMDVFRAGIATDDKRFRLKIGDANTTVALVGGNNPTEIKAIFPDTGEEFALTIGAVNYSSKPMDTDDPSQAYANWQVEGSERPLILEIDSQPYQRYLCHMTGDYQAQQIGYDTWAVTLPMEVDLSPRLYGVVT